VIAAVLKVAALPQLSGPPGLPQPATAVRLAAPFRAAFRRFAALSAGARHAWLVTHVIALREGRVTLAQLP
jgi:hypothetical protein